MRKLAICLILLSITLTDLYSQNTESLSININHPGRFYSTQKNTLWCWAACNQMLLKSQGINETQENQVLKVFGELVNKGAGAHFELASLGLGGEYLNSFNEVVKVRPYISYLGANTNDANVIITQLQNGIPIIMATKLHGRVCIGVDYLKQGYNYQITNLRLFNPFPPGTVESIPLNVFLQMENGAIGFMTLNIE